LFYYIGKNLVNISIELIYWFSLNQSILNFAVLIYCCVSFHFAWKFSKHSNFPIKNQHIDTAAKEQEFVDCCMYHLERSCIFQDNPSTELANILDSSLITVHRALNLLYSHVEAFRKKLFNVEIWNITGLHWEIVSRNPFHAKILELEGHGDVTAHNKQLKHVSSQDCPLINLHVSFEGSNEVVCKFFVDFIDYSSWYFVILKTKPLQMPIISLIGEVKAEALFIYRKLIIPEDCTSITAILKTFMNFAGVNWSFKEFSTSDFCQNYRKSIIYYCLSRSAERNR